MNDEQLKENAPYWLEHVLKGHAYFDEHTELLITNNMCTDVCPCLKYNNDTPENNPYLMYRMHLDSYMH